MAQGLIHLTTYDLVVLDVLLADMCGLALTPLVRTARSHVPILVISVNDEWEVEAREGGVDAFLTMPFSREVLIATVGRIQPSV